MKQIFNFFFLLFFVCVNAQDKNNSLKDINQNIAQEQNDFARVLRSLENSTEFKKFLTKQTKGIVVRNINNRLIYFENENITVNEKKVFQYNNLSKTDLMNCLVIDCKIFYSTYEISIQILNIKSEKTDSLIIKLID